MWTCLCKLVSESSKRRKKDKWWENKGPRITKLPQRRINLEDFHYQILRFSINYDDYGSATVKKEKKKR